MMIRSMNLPSKPRSHASDLWQEAGLEPSLSDVLRDPIIHQVMRRDGVSAEQLTAVIAQAQSGLRRRLCPCLAA